MSWQDLVLSGGGFVLAASLLPMLHFRVPAPPIKTSLPLAAVLWVYTYTMGTLDLHLAAWSTSLQAAAWTWLAVRKWRGI